MSRYINADALPRHGNRGGIVHWKDIEEAPTADVRENVKGEWIEVVLEQDEGWNVLACECSVCGRRSLNGSAFCPWCGADMRGEP